jgi:hypothetical protein
VELVFLVGVDDIPCLVPYPLSTHHFLEDHTAGLASAEKLVTVPLTQRQKAEKMASLCHIVAVWR